MSPSVLLEVRMPGYTVTMCFRSNHYWLCSITGSIINFWDLEDKITVGEMNQEVIGPAERQRHPSASLASLLIARFFAGYLVKESVEVATITC